LRGMAVYLESGLKDAEDCSVDLMDGRLFFGFASMPEDELTQLVSANACAKSCWAAVLQLVGGAAMPVWKAGNIFDETITPVQKAEINIPELVSSTLVNSFLGLELPVEAAPVEAAPVKAAPAAAKAAESSDDDWKIKALKMMTTHLTIGMPHLMTSQQQQVTVQMLKEHVPKLPHSQRNHLVHRAIGILICHCKFQSNLLSTQMPRQNSPKRTRGRQQTHLSKTSWLMAAGH